MGLRVRCENVTELAPLVQASKSRMSRTAQQAAAPDAAERGGLRSWLGLPSGLLASGASMDRRAGEPQGVERRGSKHNKGRAYGRLEVGKRRSDDISKRASTTKRECTPAHNVWRNKSRCTTCESAPGITFDRPNLPSSSARLPPPISPA